MYQRRLTEIVKISRSRSNQLKRERSYLMKIIKILYQKVQKYYIVKVINISRNKSDKSLIY